MTKGEELIALLKEHYEDKSIIESFTGNCRYYENGMHESSANHMNGRLYLKCLWYDEEKDILSAWGYGLLILYREGKWASPKLNNLTSPFYEIY